MLAVAVGNPCPVAGPKTNRVLVPSLCLGPGQGSGLEATWCVREVQHGGHARTLQTMQLVGDEDARAPFQELEDALREDMFPDMRVHRRQRRIQKHDGRLPSYCSGIYFYRVGVRPGQSPVQNNVVRGVDWSSTALVLGRVHWQANLRASA